MTRESDSHVSSRRPARKKKASTAAKHQEHDPGEEEVGDVEGGDREPVDALARAAVWSRLDVRLHGPFETACGVAKYLVCLRDPVSGFLSGRAVSDDPGAPDLLASFVFSTLCQFGLAKCICKGFPLDVFSRMSSAFSRRWRTLHPSLVRVKPDEEVLMAWSGSDQEEGSNDACDDEAFRIHVNDFVRSRGASWELHLDAWLFSQRTAIQAHHGRTAFATLFNRDPVSLDDDNECIRNVPGKEWGPHPRQRRLINAQHLCRHCGDLFTSKISFRLHQQRHYEEASRRGALDGEEDVNDKSARADSSDDWSDEDARYSRPRMKRRPAGSSTSRPPRLVDPAVRMAKLESSPPKQRPRKGGVVALEDPACEDLQSVRVDTVKAVTALLAATSRERTRRGKYGKYSPEQRDEIAEFALEHGVSAACVHFSRVLDVPVNGSTVRNFLKAYRRFSPELREEVGRYAYQFGQERCLEEYQSRQPQLNLSRALVRRFRDHFLKKNPTLPMDDNDGDHAIFDETVREQIARFAWQHDNVRAVTHFSEKLHFPVKEAFVAKLKATWMKTNGVTEEQPKVQPSEQQQQQHPPQHQVIAIQMQPQTSHVLEGGGNLHTDGSFAAQNETTSTLYRQHQQQFQVDTQLNNQSSGGVVIINQAHQTSYPHTTTLQLIPTCGFDQHPQQQQQQHVVIQHSTVPFQQMSIPQGHPTEFSYQHQQHPVVPLSLTVAAPTATDPPAEEHSQQVQQQQQSSLMNLSAAAALTDPETFGKSADENSSHEKKKSEKAEDTTKRREQTLQGRKKTKRPEKKKKSGRKVRAGIRGRYATYEPELRGLIGKYASENGNQETKEYFLSHHGIDLPESTIRGLRDKYLIRFKAQTDVAKGANAGTDITASKLDYGPRGRPVRLGRYDEVVRNCIADLVNSGVKVSSFLAIATAKQVLQKNQPELLAENGGDVSLNPTWAKSFLRRIKADLRKAREQEDVA